jgi:acyl-CoA synthetase (AMP-forming)/AMP-acid ligase II
MPDPIPQHPPTYWGLVDHRASATPDGVLFGDEYGRTLTFAEYRDEAERVAAGLHDLGVRPGTVVSWQLPTAIDSLVLLAALTRLGAVQNPIVPIMREREVRYITNEAQTEFFVVRDEWRGFAYGALAEQIAAEVGCAVLIGDTLPTGDPSVLPPPPGPERVRRWLYHTSGSTSDPKGAWHADGSVIAGMYAFVTRIQPTADDVYPICFPVSHIGGANMLAAALHVGYRLPLVEAFDAERSPLFMAEQGATLLGTALPMFQAYLAAQRKHGDDPLFPHLRTCVGGGAPKPPGIDEVIRRELGGLGVVSSWGLTEFPTATSASVDDTLEQIETTEGRASPGVELRVVSIEGKECGPGEEGELRLRGPHLFLGYANEALDVDALDEQGYFRTGDLGIVAGTGHVTITGRLKDIIIRNAENISAGEVEEILHQHPAIAEVAVIGLPDPKTGERACAVVTLVEGVTTLSLVDVAEHCRALGLARQKVPEQLEIVDDVPRNAMGKIQKPVLRKQFAP